MPSKIPHSLCKFLSVNSFTVKDINFFYSFAEGKSDKEILDQLLTNSRYDKRLLPPVDGEISTILLEAYTDKVA